MTTHTLRRIGALLLASLMLPAFALAQSSLDAAVNATAQVQTPAGGASVGASATVMARAKTKANQEIDRRIKALTELSARINAMNKVTAELKQNINTNIQNQANLLNTLKVKIEADTDAATLKTDVQSITQSYRVFALLMPQARIAAAADREATVIGMLADLGSKLQVRLQAAQQGGADVTVLVQALTAMGTSLGSAQTHAQAAISGSATLTPDQGDKDKMKANTTALQGAKAEIVAAQKDIVAARKEAETIIKGLRTLKVGASASTTVQTQ